MEGFIFSTVIWVSGGRSFLIWLIFDSMRCWLRSMLALQSMKAEISQLPLLVVLRTYWRSGTCLMAFSNGLVTVTIILSTGCNPASAMILIFGKVISGKSEVCNLLYTKPPPNNTITSVTEMGLLYRRKKFLMDYLQSGL